MADWPLVGDGQEALTYGVGGITNGGADLGATTNTTISVGCRGTLLFAAGPANGKTAWTTLININTLPFDACGFIFTLVYGTAGAAPILFDIGFGATPVAVLSNLVFRPTRNNEAGRSVYIPLAIPKNTQVSHRRQLASGVATQTDCIITPVACGFDPSPPFGVCNTYGVTTSGSTTTAILDPFSAPNNGTQSSTKGGYVVLGTTTAPVSAMLICLNENVINNGLQIRWAVDIAIGAPGSEQVIVANLPVEIESNAVQFSQNFVGPIPCHIPSGVAISARCALSTKSVTTGALIKMGIAVYCFS